MADKWPTRRPVSNDPVGVELSGVAKNAASPAAGATAGQGLNAAGAAVPPPAVRDSALRRAVAHLRRRQVTESLKRPDAT